MASKCVQWLVLLIETTYCPLSQLDVILYSTLWCLILRLECVIVRSCYFVELYCLWLLQIGEVWQFLELSLELCIWAGDEILLLLFGKSLLFTYIFAQTEVILPYEGTCSDFFWNLLVSLKRGPSVFFHCMFLYQINSGGPPRLVWQRENLKGWKIWTVETVENVEVCCCIAMPKFIVDADLRRCWLVFELGFTYAGRLLLEFCMVQQLSPQQMWQSPWLLIQLLIWLQLYNGNLRTRKKLKHDKVVEHTGMHHTAIFLVPVTLVCILLQWANC